ncbi:hypothetical protein [Modicisalibacter luteus]|uniref:hypothetical protein n=1 Tax=Modicisalibacter luteus TaxID=453962 RepID=UPI003641B2AC
MIDFSTPTLRLRRRLRHSRDRLATLLISAGGIGVIAAVLAIGVFLALEAAPLFSPARVDSETSPLPRARSRLIGWLGCISAALGRPRCWMNVAWYGEARLGKRS